MCIRRDRFRRMRPVGAPAVNGGFRQASSTSIGRSRRGCEVSAPSVIGRSHWFFLGWRDRGGMAVISAPGSSQSAVTTLHRLQTERADARAVGITTRPAVAVTIAGFQGQQFEGVVTGQYGHTFAPFSRSKGGSSASAGDHLRYAKNVAFRIVVLNVRSKPVVFLMDSNKPTLDPTFLAANGQLLKLLRFVSA